MSSDLDRLRRIAAREQHGIPPEQPVTTDEMDSDVRFLLGLLYGAYEDLHSVRSPGCDLYRDACFLPNMRKRCAKCGADGLQPSLEIDGIGYVTCESCHSAGYQEPINP